MNKKLIIHSDQIPGETQVDERFLKLCGKAPEGIKIGYIPSQSDGDGTRKYFNQKVSWYGQFGIKPENMLYFDLDKEYDPTKEVELFDSDAIFLSGGNTFHFLHNLKQKGFIEKLRKFVEKGGILIGASAGGIIMSQTIGAAGGVGIDDDDNALGLEDLSSLCLNEFDFFPHFSGSEETIEKLIEYSKGKLLYAVKDGDGIIINGDNIETVGDVVIFENGEMKD